MWYQDFLNKLAIFNWQDGIEILIFAVGFYSFSVWLQQDRQKKLVPAFYGMCSLVVGTHFMELPTVSQFLISFWPAMVMIFILVHQNSLQKNFVALRNIHSAKTVQSNWLEALLRSCLISMNNKQQILCIIEGTDSLADLIESPLIIKTKLQPQLLDMLLSSPTYEANKMIWLTSNGTLLGINAKWEQENKIENNSSDEKLDNWQQNSILFSSQTDTLMFRTHPARRTFDIVLAGKLIIDLPTDQAIKFMHKHFRKNKINKESYDSAQQTTNHSQPTS